MRKVLLAFTTLALCCAAFGQQTPAPVNSAATSACSFTFTSGTNNTFLQFCVTANGNITQLATPFAREHIAVGTIGEGYGVCDMTTNTGYYDYADFGDSGNWGPATVVSVNSSSVKIVRTTSDGVWTLTQTISQPEGNQAVRVQMSLKNNSGTDRSIFFMRYADVDVSGACSNNFDATANSAFGWDSSGSSTPPYGLTLQNVANTPGLTPIPFIQKTGAGPIPCNPSLNFTFGPLLATDGSVVMFYEGTISRNRSRTVTMNYRGM